MIYQYKLGPMENFVYLIVDEATKEAAIVDPAWDVHYVLKQAEEMGAKVTKILLTHGHFDHVNNLDSAIEATNAPVYLSEHEAEELTPDVPLNRLKDQDELNIGEIRVKVHTTPGHSPGGVCFEFDNTLLTGDTIFIQGCGRCDFEYSDPEKMSESLDKIRALPDSLNVYAGHDYGDTKTATLGTLKEENLYLKAASRRDFIHKRVGL